ncbi:MAG: prephenate dehydratase, partial [Stackebrandtia sp.]
MNGSIAYQGEPGANSAMACTEMYPGCEQLACTTFEDALEAVTDGTAALAMIPIDNSIAGRVADIHHLLPESGLHIVGEHFLRIHFQLMTVPGARLEDIRTVRSHVHALGQCRKIVRDNGWSTVVTDDTAGAAREVAALGDPSVAALAPLAAAELYGLLIVAEDVEDEHHNTTRFLVLSREPEVPPVGSGPVITSFVYRVRNVSAALYNALGGFATNGVNMTKLESYQLGGMFFATQFYADIEGHPDEPN